MKLLLACLLALPLLGALARERALPRQEDEGETIERGRYLVHHVAMCVQCHSQRRGGELAGSELFHGAPIPVRAPAGFDTWAIYAPRIAGLPGYTLEEGVRLLSEGIARDGRPPGPPMPPFRMTREDAAAVVGYLQSLE
jgi:mono/diheme cytochrome c family protein